MADTLTLMAVHAHPDDEASSTGGVLASYSAEGIRTVVVTCTNGEFGDAPGGVKPGQDGHDEPTRWPSSGWPSCGSRPRSSASPTWNCSATTTPACRNGTTRTRPDAFCNIPFDEVTGRIAALIEQYRPQVVITYDDKGLYQHPDHVYASQTAQAAVARTGIPAKLYLTAMRGSDWQKMRDAMREAGVEMPEMTLTDEQRSGRPRRGPDHHHRRHPPDALPEARRADGARQPD